MDRVIEWLLEGEPWVQYRTRLDVLGQADNDAEVLRIRQAMIDSPLIQGVLADTAQWESAVISSHKSAGHPLHKLTFIADLGLKAADPGVGAIIDRILGHQASTGPFQILMNISPHFGGTGKDEWAWALCDAPLILYALTKFGYAEDPRIRAALEYLVSLVHENGWHCSVSPELGKFRGPGRKDDPCPYANLVMLKTLAQLPAWRDNQVSHVGAEMLLTLWDARLERHPYLFYMGMDFCKLKAPLVWYDILHVLDVLTQFPWLRQDPRLRDMAAIVASKADEQGFYTPESVWGAWKDCDFGQKRVPSRWLTLLVTKVLQRIKK